MGMTALNPAKLGSAAIITGTSVAGMVAANVVQSKVKFFDSNIGRIFLIIIGVIIISKANYDAVKGVGIGIAASGATAFVKTVVGQVKGFEGVAGALAGVETDAIAGVGELVQDADGNMYMVNGMGELEEYELSGDEEEQMYGNEYLPISGLGSDTDILA